MQTMVRRVLVKSFLGAHRFPHTTNTAAPSHRGHSTTLRNLFYSHRQENKIDISKTLSSTTPRQLLSIDAACWRYLFIQCFRLPCLRTLTSGFTAGFPPSAIGPIGGVGRRCIPPVGRARRGCEDDPPAASASLSASSVLIGTPRAGPTSARRARFLSLAPSLSLEETPVRAAGGAGLSLCSAAQGWQASAPLAAPPRLRLAVAPFPPDRLLSDSARVALSSAHTGIESPQYWPPRCHQKAW